MTVRKNSIIVGALLVGRRMRVLFLSIETYSRAIFPLNQTTSLYSHFVQTISTIRRHMYLIDQLQYLLRNSRIVRNNSGIGGQSKNSYFAQDNSGIVPILTLRRTDYIYSDLYFFVVSTILRRLLSAVFSDCVVYRLANYSAVYEET